MVVRLGRARDGARCRTNADRHVPAHDGLVRMVYRWERGDLAEERGAGITGDVPEASRRQA
jgi:hypothetical protein